MLPISQTDDVKSLSTLSATPLEYLAQHRECRLRTYAETWNKRLSKDGLCLAVRNSQCVFEIAEPKKYQDYLKLVGDLSEHEVDKVVDEFPQVSERFARIQAANRKHVQELATELVPHLGPDAARLSSVPVDTIPGGYFNAEAEPVWGGSGDIVLLNDELSFLPAWERLTVHFNAEYNKLQLPDLHNLSFADLPIQFQRAATFKLAFADYLINGELDFHVLMQALRFLNIESSSEDVDILVSWFANEILKYVLLHEFGHIARGHTDECRAWLQSDRSLTNEQLLRRSARRREFEFEADRFAMLYIKRKYDEDMKDQEVDSAQMAMGINVVLPPETLAYMASITHLFELFNTAETARKAKGKHEPPELRTHPGPFERLEKVLITLFEDRVDPEVIRTGFRRNAN